MKQNTTTQAMWPLFRAACYLKGKGLTYGQPFIPAAALNQGVYSIVIGLTKTPGVAAFDQSLGVISDRSLDHVVVTPVVAAADSPLDVIREACAKLKIGGHLVLVLKPGVEEKGIHLVEQADVIATVSTCGKWRTKAEYTQDGLWMLVLKRVEGSKGILPAAPVPGRRACIARYGALGDAVMMTPLVQRLHDDGYHVTLNVSQYCAPVFENNPYVDNLLIQERDMVPNHMLGDYWNLWEADYDKFINLSESIEGDLLQIEGRPQFFTPATWRRGIARHNYYDYTMARGGYTDTPSPRGQLFYTDAEHRRAQRWWSRMAGKFTILWALNGSSKHKVYPLMEPMLEEWLPSHPDAQVVTVGDYTGKLLEFDHPQLTGMAGEWSIRESMIATEYAKLVVGPETAITNASGCCATPKIVLLSHSARHNLTKYWENDYSLTPDTDTAPCYPCHQLHYTAESCPTGEMTDSVTGESLGKSPICTLAISPHTLMDQMDVVYNVWKSKR